MQANENLPYAELRKFGIVDYQNKFNPKLNENDVKNFLNGHTLIADNENTRLTFKLDSTGSKLDVEAYQKDIINHNDLSTQELFEIASSNKALYKPKADFGELTNTGFVHYNNNPKNEVVFFAEVENERGKTVFFGNDLQEKLKDFTIGDKVQITNTGVEKQTIQYNGENGIENINRYENLFDVKKSTPENEKSASMLFDYDSKTKNIVGMDTSAFEYNEINGVKLTPKQLSSLKKGEEVTLDDETTVQLSPKAENDAKITSNNKKLLLASILLDGGISFLIISAVRKLKSMEQTTQKQVESKKYHDELMKLKGFLQSKATQYPDNKKIVNDINIVGKEISSVGASMKTAGKNDKTKDGTVRLNVNDRDMYEDANRKKEQDWHKANDSENETERSTSRGRGR